MANKRDDSSEKTKHIIASGVAYRFSKPDRQVQTCGPCEDTTSYYNIVIACHITAASRAGRPLRRKPHTGTEGAPQQGDWTRHGHNVCNSESNNAARRPAYAAPLASKELLLAEAELIVLLAEEGFALAGALVQGFPVDGLSLGPKFLTEAGADGTRAFWEQGRGARGQRGQDGPQHPQGISGDGVTTVGKQADRCSPQQSAGQCS